MENLASERISVSDPRLARLGRFLAASPSIVAMLEYLTVNNLKEWCARAAWIACPRPTGVFDLEGSYGSVDAHSFAASPPSVWGANPLAVALEVETGQTALVTDLKEAPLPFMDAEIEHLITCSTYPTAQVRYVLGIGCQGDKAMAEQCSQALLQMTPLVATYLGLRDARMVTAPGNSLSAGSSDAKSSLTPRQSTILRLLSENMKNREIAFAIGYSESTVRIETISIYEKLGVSGRREAVRVAERLGILED